MADRGVVKSDKMPGWCESCNQLQMHYRLVRTGNQYLNPLPETPWHCGVCGKGRVVKSTKDLLEKPHA